MAQLPQVIFHTQTHLVLFSSAPCRVGLAECVSDSQVKSCGPGEELSLHPSSRGVAPSPQRTVEVPSRFCQHCLYAEEESKEQNDGLSLNTLTGWTTAS